MLECAENKLRKGMRDTTPINPKIDHYFFVTEKINGINRIIVNFYIRKHWIDNVPDDIQ